MFDNYTTVYVEIQYCGHSCVCGRVEAGFCGSKFGGEAVRFYVGNFITATMGDTEKSARLQREHDAIKEIVGGMYFDVETAVPACTRRINRNVRPLKVNEALAIVGRMGHYEYSDEVNSDTASNL